MVRTVMSPRAYYTDERMRGLIRNFEKEVEASRGKFDSPLLSNLLPIVRDIMNDYETPPDGWIIAGFLSPLIAATCPGNIMFGSGNPILHSGLRNPACPPEILSLACRHRYRVFADIAVENENCPEADAVYAALRKAAEQEG